MSDEELLAEGAALLACASAGADLGGEAGEIAPALLIGLGEDEGDQGGAAGYDGEAELPGKIVTKAGRAHLGDGESAGGDDEGG